MPYLPDLSNGPDSWPGWDKRSLNSVCLHPEERLEENVSKYEGLLEGFNVLLKSGDITMVFISETCDWHHQSALTLSDVEPSGELIDNQAGFMKDLDELESVIWLVVNVGKLYAAQCRRASVVPLCPKSLELVSRMLTLQFSGITPQPSSEKQPPFINPSYNFLQSV